MTRPLMQHRIDELEALFETSREDAAGLRKLETELTCRQMPRAVALLLKVRRILGGEGAITAARHQDLFGDVVPTASPASHSSKTGAEPAATPAVSRNSTPPAQAVSATDIENAYKALRVTRAATWEVVESSRRQIVDRARPDAVLRLDAREREVRRQEAMRANAAYLMIARTKTQ